MDNNLASPNGKPTRSSLACLPCRSRHLKCDGGKPICTRCVQAAKECHYARSRRGGLDRAALAERRKRLAAVQGDSSVATSVRTSHAQDEDRQSQPVGASILDDPDLLAGIGDNDTVSGLWISKPQIHVNNLKNDALINHYYQNFHESHPLILPRGNLIKHYHDANGQSSFKPLVAVLRFIGHLYSAKEWSLPFQDFLEASFSQASQLHPVMVQCRLLYSIAHFWYGHKTEAQREMDAAVKLAIKLEMFRAEFANEYGEGDAVLAESWRRTWWTTYLVEAYYAGTLGTMNFAALNIEATTGLPCEESEYQSGVCTAHHLVKPGFHFTHPDHSHSPLG